MKTLREIGIVVLIAVAVFVLLQLNVQSYIVKYGSMEPGIYEDECIMVNKASYRSSAPQRGEVIVFDPPFDSPHPFIKRVIGLPGETVEVKDGKVFIDGIPLEEEYLNETPNYTMPATEVPEGRYFVLGDNRNNSNDSHNNWTVPRENIIGRAWFTYWPPNRWGIKKHYRYPELVVEQETNEYEVVEQGTIAGYSIEV